MDNQENKLENEQTKFFKDILTNENLKNVQDSEQPTQNEIHIENKKDFPFLYLGKFFLSMTIVKLILSVILNIISLDLYKDITNYIEVAKRSNMVLYPAKILSLFAVLIPYIIIRLQMKRDNKKKGIYWLDIFVFSLICIHSVEVFKLFNIDVYNYLKNSSSLIFYIILTSLFIFIIGRYIKNKVLCGVAIGYIISIFIILLDLYLTYQPIEYCAHTIMHQLDDYQNNINIRNIIIAVCISFYSLAGQLFLGIYLLIKSKKKNQNY